MEQISYSDYPVKRKHTSIPEEIKNLIIDSNEYSEDDIENIEDCGFDMHEVKSPFILADNEFDLAEANNTLIEINVKKVKTCIFTGGAFYSIYEKTNDDSYLIHGNEEEGFNIFHLV